MEIMTSIITLLVSGITELGQGIGSALSELATAIFLSGSGDTQTLSVFGTLVVIFAGVSLAFGLTRWALNFITSLGSSNN